MASSTPAKNSATMPSRAGIPISAQYPAVCDAVQFGSPSSFPAHDSPEKYWSPSCCARKRQSPSSFCHSAPKRPIFPSDHLPPSSIGAPAGSCPCNCPVPPFTSLLPPRNPKRELCYGDGDGDQTRTRSLGCPVCGCPSHLAERNFLHAAELRLIKDELNDIAARLAILEMKQSAGKSGPKGGRITPSEDMWIEETEEGSFVCGTSPNGTAIKFPLSTIPTAP